MAKFISEKIKKKSAARLAAVQATYMIEYGQLPVDEVIKDFVNGEIGRYAIEEESDGYEVLENMVEIEEMDADYFSNLTRNVHKDKEHLERSWLITSNKVGSLTVLTAPCGRCCYARRMSWCIQQMLTRR